MALIGLDEAKNYLRVAVLYSLGYLFEHREEADHHALTLTLRSVDLMNYQRKKLKFQTVREAR